MLKLSVPNNANSKAILLNRTKFIRNIRKQWEPTPTPLPNRSMLLLQKVKVVRIKSTEFLSCSGCVWLFATSWTVACPGSSVHGDSPSKKTGLGCHTLLQGIFPTQISNPDLLHCRQILYCLNHQGISTRNWGNFPLFNAAKTSYLKIK